MITSFVYQRRPRRHEDDNDDEEEEYDAEMIKEEENGAPGVGEGGLTTKRMRRKTMMKVYNLADTSNSLSFCLSVCLQSLVN